MPFDTTVAGLTRTIASMTCGQDLHKATPKEPGPGMIAEVDRGVVDAEPPTDAEGRGARIERSTAAKTENEDQCNGRENCHHDRNGTAGS